MQSTSLLILLMSDQNVVDVLKFLERAVLFKDSCI